MATIWLRYAGYLGERLASLIIGGIGAFATAALALATYTTILQNRRTVKELQKDRRKPLAEDVLRQLVIPSIQRLDSKIEEMEREITTWVQIRDAYGSPVGNIPHEGLLYDDINNTVLRELERDNPVLLEQIKNHDEAARSMEETVDEILEILEERVQEFVDEHENDEGEPIDIELIARYVQAEHTRDLSPRNHEEFWESHGELLRELKDETIISRIDEAETEYLECCKSLKKQLINYMTDIQQRYGISEQDTRL